VTTDDPIVHAAAAIAAADALLVTAGAGMGVDSGLPDFRGNQGFWRAYPAYAQLGLSFVELANPRWFRDDPALAWGFYGHRLNLYRATAPHAGFARLLAWCASRRRGGYVLTSNVDGHFQRAGWDPARIVEAHGTIDIWQCVAGCGAEPFPAASADLKVDPVTFRAAAPLPTCVACGGLARPNILMFGDDDWDERRTLVQQGGLERWLVDAGRSSGRLVIIECGAGTVVPTIRATGEGLARRMGATIIRINPREPGVFRQAIAITVGAAEALARIDDALVALTRGN
jgi:NAD-dependent SIR2 family protein deacetylase